MVLSGENVQTDCCLGVIALVIRVLTDKMLSCIPPILVCDHLRLHCTSLEKSMFVITQPSKLTQSQTGFICRGTLKMDSVDERTRNNISILAKFF